MKKANPDNGMTPSIKNWFPSVKAKRPFPAPLQAQFAAAAAVAAPPPPPLPSGAAAAAVAAPPPPPPPSGRWIGGKKGMNFRKEWDAQVAATPKPFSKADRQILVSSYLQGYAAIGETRTHRNATDAIIDSQRAKGYKTNVSKGTLAIFCV
jgi:hypothetical protein